MTPTRAAVHEALITVWTQHTKCCAAYDKSLWTELDRAIDAALAPLTRVREAAEIGVRHGKPVNAEFLLEILDEGGRQPE